MTDVTIAFIIGLFIGFMGGFFMAAMLSANEYDSEDSEQ
jgi:hypothetical protein